MNYGKEQIILHNRIDGQIVSSKVEHRMVYCTHKEPRKFWVIIMKKRLEANLINGQWFYFRDAKTVTKLVL